MTSWLDRRVPPLIVMAAIGLAMAGAARLVPALDLDWPWLDPAAWLVGAVGCILAGSGVYEFGKAKTTRDPRQGAAASTLVVGGFYRATRNPMYLGMLLLLVAWGAWLANLGALATIVIFVLYMNRFQIEPEERYLQGRFGEDYRAYARRVRRWI